MRKQCIIIAGPTASGKTSVAISLAKQLSTEIISADSRQCYKELNIGVARPTPEELLQVPHHFIASHSIHDLVTANDFANYATHKIHALFERYEFVVMVGGTGLYIKAFAEGLDSIPKVPDEIRLTINKLYAFNGIKWLQEQIKDKDPLYAAVGEMLNPQRMMRALEVWQYTGKSIIELRQSKKIKHDFDIRILGLEMQRSALNARIDKRVDQMIMEGLLEEVKNLQAFQSLNALNTVGYTELFACLEGKLSLEDAVNQIKIHTHQYAKRQVTWFNKVVGLQWMKPEDVVQNWNKI